MPRCGRPQRHEGARQRSHRRCRCHRRTRGAPARRLGQRRRCAIAARRAGAGRPIGSQHRRGGSSANVADYLIFGALFQTASKDAGHPTASLDDLRSACRAAGGDTRPCDRRYDGRARLRSCSRRRCRSSLVSASSCRRRACLPIVICTALSRSCGVRLTRARPFPYIDRPPLPRLRRDPPKRFARRRA